MPQCFTFSAVVSPQPPAQLHGLHTGKPGSFGDGVEAKAGELH
jgi:hypothetical protein